MAVPEPLVEDQNPNDLGDEEFEPTDNPATIEAGKHDTDEPTDWDDYYLGDDNDVEEAA